MADDITLTIRVRDATRNAISRVERDLARLQTRLRRSSRDSNAFDRLGDRLRTLQSRLHTSSAFVGRFRGALNQAAARGITPLARAADAMGNRTRRVFGQMTHAVGNFRNTFSRFHQMWGRAGDGVRNFGNRIAHTSRLMKIFLLILALIGPAAQALGAILITVLAASFLALGAFALRGDAQVRTAFKSMKSTIGSTVREAAQPLKGSLIAGMEQLGKAAQGLGPLLKQAFTNTGPLVKDLVGGITNLAAGALPGMTAALGAAEPAMKGFKNAMGDVGEGLGDMFKKMTVGNEKGLEQAWERMGVELQNLLTNIGEFIAEMSKSGSASLLFIGVFRSFSGVLHLVEAAFKAIDAVAGPFFQKISGWVTGMSGLQGVSKNVASSFDYMGRSSKSLKKELADTQAQIKKIEKVTSGISSPSLKKEAQRGSGLPGLEEKEAALKAAIANASGQATAANKKEAASVGDLINKIRELNELNRGSLDARAALEQSIDDAAKGYTKYAHALKYTNGQLDLDKKSSRDAYEMLSKIAGATNDATKKAQDAKAPWKQVIAEWKRGRSSIIKFGEGMKMTHADAVKLADSIVKMPDKKLHIKASIADLKQKIKEAKANLRKVPDSRKAKVRGDISDLRAKLAQARFDLARINGQTATVRIMTEYFTAKSPSQLAAAHGRAAGGLAPGYAGGGHALQTHPNGGLISGPGTGTSDSIMEMSPNGGMYRTSDREYIVQGSAVRKYGVGMLDMLNAGRLKLAGYKKGGLAKGEKSARSEARGELSVSHFGHMAGYKNDEFKNQLGLPDALAGLVSSLNHWRSMIKRATHGGVEKSLLKQLDKAGKSLIKYEKSLTKVEKSLDKAKTKLDDLKSAASSLKESVTSGVMSATNITRNSGEDKNLTVANLMATMTEGRDKATAFSGALKSLKKKGVSKEIIKQIAEAGIDGGGMETAGTLLTASASEIKSMNSLQGQITKASKSAGKTAADAMYAAGIKAAEGLVKGLEKKQKSIEKAMMKIAKSMEKAIKHALGIHSPSKVMERVGHYTAEGFVTGVQKNSKIDSAWESMLTTRSTAGGSAGSSAGYGGGGSPEIIQISIGGKVLDEIILDSNRRTVRTRGGNVQAVYGRRNG